MGGRAEPDLVAERVVYLRAEWQHTSTPLATLAPVTSRCSHRAATLSTITSFAGRLAIGPTNMRPTT